VRRWAPTVREYVAVAERSDSRDALRLQVELPEDYPDEAMLLETLQREFKAAVGVSARLERVPLGHTASLTGAGRELKVRRVFDHRGS
jgi:phenylacetate-coenzyme A ligase PaaK-like adenylate-forming protein